LHDKQDYAGLWSLCNQHLENGADTAPFHFFRALADVKLKQRYDEAIADLKKVANTDPENLAMYAYSELAEAYRDSNQIKPCEDSLMQYQTLNGYAETAQEKEKAGDAASKFCSEERPQ